MEKEINNILMQLQNNSIDINQATNLLLKLLSVSLPHQSLIETALDKLMIIRGEHPTRVRHPLYGEERQLAIDLVKHVLLNNKPDENEI